MYNLSSAVVLQTEKIQMSASATTANTKWSKSDYDSQSGWLSLMGKPRYRVVAVCFLATFCAYIERVGFSIAFTDVARTGGLDEAVKGTVLSSFYWGYGLSQVTTKGLHWGSFLYILRVEFVLWNAMRIVVLHQRSGTKKFVLQRV